MGNIEFEDQKIDVPDGEPIKDACMELGVPFGCENGICGTCMVKVLEGEENLSPKTEEEESMELDPGVRLGCQCKLKSGNVKLDL